MAGCPIMNSCYYRIHSNFQKVFQLLDFENNIFDKSKYITSSDV